MLPSNITKKGHRNVQDFTICQTYDRKVEVNHENAIQQMSMVAQRSHMATIYFSFTYWDPLFYHSYLFQKWSMKWGCIFKPCFNLPIQTYRAQYETYWWDLFQIEIYVLINITDLQKCGPNWDISFLIKAPKNTMMHNSNSRHMTQVQEKC